jgi:hypothetical protein
MKKSTQVYFCVQQLTFVYFDVMLLRDVSVICDCMIAVGILHHQFSLT